MCGWFLSDEIAELLEALDEQRLEYRCSQGTGRNRCRIQTGESRHPVARYRDRSQNEPSLVKGADQPPPPSPPPDLGILAGTRIRIQRPSELMMMVRAPRSSDTEMGPPRTTTSTPSTFP